MNYSFDILTLQSPSPKTQNSDHLNIIHTKKPIEKNGSRYQIAAVNSIFFIFFAKTPFFLFCLSAFLFALFLFPFVLLSSQPFFFFCAPLPDQACEAFKFKFICLCHVHQVLTSCTCIIYFIIYIILYLVLIVYFIFLYYFILSIDCLFY